MFNDAVSEAATAYHDAHARLFPNRLLRNGRLPLAYLRP